MLEWTGSGRRGGGGVAGGSWYRIPALFSREFRIPHFLSPLSRIPFFFPWNYIKSLISTKARKCKINSSPFGWYFELTRLFKASCKKKTFCTSVWRQLEHDMAIVTSRPFYSTPSLLKTSANPVKVFTIQVLHEVGQVVVFTTASQNIEFLFVDRRGSGRG